FFALEVRAIWKSTSPSSRGICQWSSRFVRSSCSSSINSRIGVSIGMGTQLANGEKCGTAALGCGLQCGTAALGCGLQCGTAALGCGLQCGTAALGCVPPWAEDSFCGAGFPACLPSKREPAPQ